MAINVWIHWIGENQKPEHCKVVDLLIQQSIKVQSLDAYSCCNSGVIFSSEVTPEVCNQLRELSRNGHNSVLVCCCKPILGDAIWQLMEAGASDVLVFTEYSVIAHEIAARLQRWEIVDRMVNSPTVQNSLVGQSQALKTILRQVVEVAYFTDASVLILGESGTGKELVANLIHALDTRSNKGELVILDCSTITPELSGSEFYGHERGAFTGQ